MAGIATHLVQRRAVAKSYREGKTCEQIAAEWNTSADTILRLLHKVGEPVRMNSWRRQQFRAAAKRVQARA